MNDRIGFHNDIIEQKINKYGPKDDQNYESYADLHGVYVR